ncbi:MAG: hypothetical protein HDT51_00460 [Alistipes sp.]|nr:hypothetical protein [Alistipes sp.]
MKNLLIFVAGVITGIVFIVLLSVFISTVDNQGITMFDEPGDYIQGNRFEVLQEVRPGAALAHAEDKKYGISTFTGVLVLFVNDEGKRYYDEEIIKIPNGKRVRQVGIYKYESKAGAAKTVPVVRITE